MFKTLTIAKKIANAWLLFFFIIYFPGTSFAYQVTDEIGRKVNIKNVPQRIVSLAPGVTETLYAMNLGSKIVGVTSYCNWPAEAKQKQQIGGFINPSIEKIISLQPDLIIATADGNRKETIDQLQRVGLPVYVTNPANTSGLINSILHIGEITAEEKAAHILVGSLQKRLDNIRRQTKGKSRPRVFFQIGFEPVITAGRGTLIDEIITQAGGLNIAGNETARYPRYSAESLMAGSPDIILFAPMANDKEFTAAKNFWQNFQEIPAIRNNKFYPIETDLISRASPRIIDAIEKMALIFHPEITGINPKASFGN
jgi:iron complex transport system substrate-binding protein